MRAFFLLCVSRAGLCLGTMMFAGALPTISANGVQPDQRPGVAGGFLVV
jgi:hypothetical protein